MFLRGRSAIVTGSTSGIGLAIATALAGEGAAVTINGFGDPQAVEASRASLTEASGAQARYDPADMSQPDEIAAMVQRTAAAQGGVDILVNNAGIQHVSPIESFPPEKYEAIIAINMSSAFYAIQAALAGMKAKGWGRIISTASAHSLVASPNKAAYVMAKHGIIGLTKTAALETARDGITVNAISPGYVWTPLVEAQIPDTMRARNMTREQVMNDVLLAAQPTKAFVTPEQVAALALFLCRDEASAITGANLSMDGGWTAA
ncbi:3-hydroxybutyrate dehydrogenase [uncultured Sphingomonas sp.]|uniref:3-hydroxybutyrate dehydrogenase n=1 Tax=uncultured Sphingomonas sp. TaxID=158754 RepID=UPI0035CB9AC1